MSFICASWSVDVCCREERRDQVRRVGSECSCHRQQSFVLLHRWKRALNPPATHCQLYLYIFIYFIYVFKLIYKAPRGRNFRSAVSFRRWLKPSPVLIAPTRRRMARLSGPG